MIHLNTWPYSLLPVAGSFGPHKGHAFLRQPSAHHDPELSLFQLSNRGSIHRLDFRMSGETRSGPPTAPPKFNWSRDVDALSNKAARLRSDPGPSAQRAFARVDFTPVYAREHHSDLMSHTIYHDQLIDISRGPEVKESDGHMPTISEMLEKMPPLWREPKASPDHLVTT